MSLTDEEIVQAVLAGKKARFSDIVNRYERPVFNLMYRYARHEQDAADLTQEVFLRAFNRLATFRADRSFFSWLYTLAVNHANDWSRSRRRRQDGEQAHRLEKAGSVESVDPTREMESCEQSEMLQAALNLLPSETREILLLRYRHEQPIREVAAVFALTESAAKMRIKRGLEQLQRILSERGDDETRAR